MNLTELIQRSTEIANRGQGVTDAAVQDVEALAEPLVPQMFRALAYDYVADGKTDLLAMKSSTLAFVNGSAPVSEDVLHACLDLSYIVDTADPRKLYSYVHWFPDFVRVFDRRIGYYCVQVPGTMQILEPNSSYSASSGFTGSRVLTTPSVWDLPTDATTDIDARDEVTTDMVMKLAEMIEETLVNQEEAVVGS